MLNRVETIHTPMGRRSETGLSQNLEIGDISCMLMDQITDEVIARQTPEAQSIIRL